MNKCAWPPQKINTLNILETIVDHNDRHNAPFFDGKIQQAVSKLMAETEEE